MYSGSGLIIRQFQRKLPVEIKVFPNLVNLKKTDLQTRKDYPSNMVLLL